jgi:DNA repair protein RadA
MADKEIENISDIPGVGDKIADKLKKAGYIDMMSLAAASPMEVANAAEIGEPTADKIIRTARKVMKIDFETAAEVSRRRESIGKISTGSKNLDTLLGGGIETQAVTEFHGAFGSGKTQIGFQLAINVQLPVEKGGLNAPCVIIDAENTFRPSRVKQMADAMGLDSEKILENIYVARAYNSDHQMVLTEKLGEMIKEKGIKLVVVDSVTSNFRADFVGRGTLADRQQHLNRHLHTLQRLADVYDVAIYITNQVMARPDVLFGDPTTPIGGHILGHFSTHRVYVRKSKANRRIARVIDSPNLAEGEAVFLITPEGIKDPEEDEKE